MATDKADSEDGSKLTLDERLAGYLLHVCGNPLYAVASMYMSPPVKPEHVAEAKEQFLGELEHLISNPSEFERKKGYRLSPADINLLEDLKLIARVNDWNILDEFAIVYQNFGLEVAMHVKGMKGEPRYNAGDAERFLEQANQVNKQYNNGGK